MSLADGDKAILKVLDGKACHPAPVWLMRQAGRYLPEYRELRARTESFLDLCFTPKLAAEATLQPVRRFGMDAAILFSDILVVPYALGQSVSFETSEGPQLAPAIGSGDSHGLKDKIDLGMLAPVFDTIALVRANLPKSVTLLGFCGAPWTVATYMVAGHGTSDQAPARLLAYRDAEAFGRLIDLLVEASIDYLVGQFKAGVDAVQLFDTWAGVLGPLEFARWCIEPAARIVAGVRREIPGAKIIGFPRGAGTLLGWFVDAVPVSALGLDWAIDRDFCAAGNPGPLSGAGQFGSAGLACRWSGPRPRGRGGAGGVCGKTVHFQSRPRRSSADPGGSCGADADPNTTIGGVNAGHGVSEDKLVDRGADRDCCGWRPGRRSCAGCSRSPL